MGFVVEIVTHLLPVVRGKVSEVGRGRKSVAGEVTSGRDDVGPGDLGSKVASEEVWC